MAKIGFNGGKATLYGVLCLSPFFTPRPMTLWYVPVIIICYLLTPLICRHDFKYRLISSLCIILLVMCVGMIKAIDYRFKFNLFFYLVGLVSSPYITWRFLGKFGTIIKTTIVVFYIALLSICHSFPFLIQIMISGVGVFAVLFVCEAMAKFVFPIAMRQNEKRGVPFIKNAVMYASYASMTCYMFHRLFFWFGELLWNPANPAVKWLYMAGVVFPVMIVLSYYIQFGYDWVVKQIIRKK